ncbi:MAG: hypothetical protein ACRDF0_00910 [Candidatus Limnocylindria bacterium]
MITVLLAAPAAACRWPSGGTAYTPNNSLAEQFQFGQYSQGGNYYYGVAGQISTTYPPDPVDATTWSVPQHVATLFGSSDDRSSPGQEGWVYTGWTVGWIGSYRATSATVFAEYFNYDGSFVQAPAGSAPSTLWYMTRLGGSLGGGYWRYDAYTHNGEYWELITANYSTLTTSTTVQDVFGEVTDKVQRDVNGRITSHGTCNLHSNPNTAVNAYSGLQLYVDNAAWQSWTPANGRYASAVTASPYYRDDPIDYTDVHVGGPRP